MKTKRLLSILFAFALLLGVMSISVSANTTPVAQVGDVTYTSLADAIEATKEGGTVTLLDNIVLDGWTTVDTYSGTIMGAGKTISGLNAPLFNTISGAAIENLTIEANIEVENPEGDGAAVAIWTAGTTNLTKVTVNGSVTAGSAAGFFAKGVGQLTITDCVNNATIIGTDRKAAGFINSTGKAASGDVITIIGCVNNGNVTANQTTTPTTSTAAEVYAAGFIAWNGATGLTVNITNCTNNGAILGERTRDGGSTVAAGGIIGTCWNGNVATTLTNVTNTGNVTAVNKATAHNAYAGGIVGLNNPSSITVVESAAVSGTITATIDNAANTTSNACAGGISGQMNNNSSSVLTVESADVTEITLAASGGANQYEAAVVGNQVNGNTSLTVETVTAAEGMALVGNTEATGGAVAKVGNTYYNSLQAAVDAAADGDTVTVIADICYPIDESTAPNTPDIVVTKDITIDFGGHTIEGYGHLFRIVADVTVKNGTLNCSAENKGGYCFFVGQNNSGTLVPGNLTIESGTYSAQNSVVSVTSGTATVIDGDFTAVSSNTGATFMFNCIDGRYPDICNIMIKGGTFHDFDPANNTAEGAGTNFVAEGYKSVDNGDGTYTVEKEIWTTATDAGFYMVGEEKVGMMRFLFAADAEGVTASGIKFIKGEDINTQVGEIVSGTSNAFYGDIIGIPATETEGTYYAMAYIETAEGIVWSDPLPCTIDWTKQFTNYGGAQ